MKSIINTKLFLSGVTILASAAIVIGATFAFFSDTETSQNNTLVAGALDLKIDNTSYYNGVLNQGTTWTLNDLTDQLFFDFTDVKPNDLGEDTISLHTENDAWVCAEFSLTENNDNTCTTNELEDDPTCNEPNGNSFDGELAQNINFAFWSDDGDNVLEDNEGIIASGSAEDVLDSEITLADSTTNNLGGVDGTPMTGGETHYIAKSWCFGALGLEPLTQDNQGTESARTPANSTGGVSCDGSNLNNATQSDRVLADIEFTAVQSRNNPDFVCGETEPSVTPTPTPPQISCETGDNIFANSFNDNDQGLRKDGSAVLANRSVPSAAFGAPQTSGADSDVGFPAGSFFSLGFPNVGTSSATASIVFGFAEPFFPNPSGADLQVFEVTGGVYPDEKVKIEASSSPLGPWTVLAASATRDEGVELGVLPSAQYVRLTDVSDINLFPNDADGYDVDALKAFCTQVNIE